MIRFSRGILALLLAIALTSCISAPPDLTSTLTSEAIMVPAGKVLITNLIREQKINSSDALWSNDLHPLPYNSTIPPFDDLILSNLKNRVKGSLGNDSDNLEISVIDTNLLMESHVSDSIMFVGMASAFSERKYVCRLDVNLRFKDKSIRKTFDAVDTKTRSWADLPTDDKATMVRKCLDTLIANVADFSAGVIKNQ